MIIFRFLFSGFLLSFFLVAGAQTDSLKKIEAFGNNPGKLNMYMYGSDSMSYMEPKPLVVVLHGCGQTAREVADLTGWNKLARLNDFIVVYPQQKIWNNMSTCFNWFRNGDINKGSGECESIFQMIRYMQEHYPIDNRQIFITGLSAGGAMAVIMMATHPSVFNSGAIFAGGAYKLATDVFQSAGVMAGTKKLPKEELVQLVREQNPDYTGPYPTMVIYQGMSDLVVNHKNADLLIDQWTGLHECDNVPDSITLPFKGVKDLQRMDYKDSSGKTVLIFYKVDNLGHRVLVNPGPGNNQGGETGTYGADRNFHSTYQTALDFGILKQEN